MEQKLVLQLVHSKVRIHCMVFHLWTLVKLPLVEIKYEQTPGKNYMDDKMLRKGFQSLRMPIF